MTIYKEFIKTKTNISIPLLNSGRTVESRYNPEKEAENIISSLEKKYNAFLVPGISSGVLLEKLSTTFTNSLIIAFEISQADIDFLLTDIEIKKRLNYPNIKLCTLENLETTLLQNYLPAKYGDLKVLEQRNWVNETISKINEIKNIIQSAINNISADFSVQSHFGKIWCSNIMNNIKLLSKIENKEYLIDSKKNAYIIAAGPSVEDKIQNIKNDNNAFIIATDTSLQILKKYNIVPEIVISIDGQNVSHNHFMNSGDNKKTIFLFDLAADFTAAKYIHENNLKLAFFISNHPLAILFNNYSKSQLLNLFSGSGTVTITALDFAVKSGFKNITVIGADFSYSKGKAYTKGSYLDLLYNKNSGKILNNEMQYDKLLFRTELLASDKNHTTTPVLNSYKSSFIDYIENNNLTYSFSEDIYKIKNEQCNGIVIKNKKVNYSEFVEYLKNSSAEEIQVALLPLISYLRKSTLYNEDLNYDDFLKLAHSFIVRYN